MKTRYGILLAVLMLVCSCGSKDFTDDILKMQSRPIDLKACKDAVYLENGVDADFCDEDSVYKLILYIDSASCSPCFVSHITDYMETVETFDSLGIATLFVFEPKAGHENEVVSLIQSRYCPFRTAIVPGGSFSASNPHIPELSMLHSFLLNADNEVVVVGNPDRNSKVKELMLDMIK